MERPPTLDPTEATECRFAPRHLNETHSPQPNAFDYSNSFTFFGDIYQLIIILISI